MALSVESLQDAKEDVISFLKEQSSEIGKVVSEMSEKSKGVAASVYEGIYKTPIANRIVGRMEIAYNQFWVDKHEDKENLLKDRIDGKKNEIGKLDQSISTVRSSVETLSGLNQDTRSVQKRIDQFERKKEGLLIKQEALQAKYQRRVEKKEAFRDRRDEIADKLIGYYRERLIPIEGRVHNLDRNVDVLQFDVLADEIRNKERVANINEIKEAKRKIEEGYKDAGMSSFRVSLDRGIGQLGRVIRKGENEIDKEQGELLKQKLEITKRKEKVQKVKEKTLPYENKIYELETVKKANTKEVPVVSEVTPKVDLLKREDRFKVYEENVMPESGDVSERQKLETVEEFISKWNTKLVERRGPKARNQINMQKFVSITEFSPENKMTSEDFKKILLGNKRLMWRYRKTEILNAE